MSAVTAAAAAGLKASSLKAFGLAAAGHDGVLSDESGALIIKPCTPLEVAFYESAASHAISAWIPTYFGTLELSAELPDPSVTPVHGRNTSIVLSSSTYGFSKPCVLDIKLGAQLWDDNAPQDKRDRLDAVSNKTTSSSLGMRIAGMRVWKKGTDGADGYYKVYDKHFGRTFQAENVVGALMEYFDSDITSAQVTLLATRFAKKVGEIKAVLEAGESRMYSASLLFVYEGDGAVLDEALAEEAENAKKPAKTQEEEEEEEEEEEDKQVKKVEDLKMIDFAHATWTPGKGPDENALHGVRSAETLLKEISGI
ncbi:hypothetical protein Q9L58_006685 [Maublancomyces gigas]|uniref:Kinase n=1 Tax=Discina gigas TaxID=1032678 RepID=A0ABR3GEL8_9PEZI